MSKAEAAKCGRSDFSEQKESWYRPDEVDWVVSPGLVPYPLALAMMEQRVSAISGGRARELVWLLEHPPLYTAGTSAKPQDLKDPGKLPVFQSGRGGQYTYHGPGQRVIYVMLDLNHRNRDVRAFVSALEAWIIEVLRRIGVDGETHQDRVGVWVKHDGEQEDKIAALGIRLRRWVSLHGISLNISPRLDDFSGIVPCGIEDRGVTSLAALGRPHRMGDIDTLIEDVFNELFGPTRHVAQILDGTSAPNP